MTASLNFWLLFVEDKWIRLYQLPPYCLGKRKTRERELMVRPRYPNILNQNEIPCDDGISEQAVVIDNSWQVGDLVDWWTTGCWWSGTILQLLDGGKAQVIILCGFLVMKLLSDYRYGIPTVLYCFLAKLFFIKLWLVATVFVTDQYFVHATRFIVTLQYFIIHIILYPPN